MSIRSKWILTLGIIAVLSILVNAGVLSILMSNYFNSYLEETYDQTSEKIVAYLSDELLNDGYSTDTISKKLETFLGDSILEIEVYDSSDSLIVDVSDSSISNSERGMGMMSEQMNERMKGMLSSDNVDESFTLENDAGTVIITRYSSSSNSYDSKMFQSSLIRNSLISIGIVSFLVFILGVIMSKKVSRDLKYTANLAHNIDMGEENNVSFSKTKEIRTIQQSLKSLESRLKLKQKSRKTLIDEMVHQTRTPLTILKMHIEGFEDGVMEPDPEELKVCENQIDNLSDIITNISMLIDAGTSEHKVVVEEFELSHFLKQILNGMKAQFQKKNIDIKLLANEKIMIKTDKYLLGQSIYNIITNAYKYTPAGGEVTLKYRKDESGIFVEIKDTGYGISKEVQKKIFDAYYKNNQESENAGDGLGLFVAKENMESIKGTIEVVSEVGKGSTFILKIPVE